MPKNTTTAWEFQQRIMEAQPGINKRYAQRAAYRIKRQMDWQAAHDERIKNMTEDQMYDEGLRILGIITDTTPRDAIKNIERMAA